MTRRQVARVGAPAAFLAAVTIAVLLIRAGLGGGGGTTTTASVPTATVPQATRAAATTTRTRTATATTKSAEFYTVAAGDTFGTIAARFGTTVAQLEQLNPGVSSSSLSIGQRIRVK